MIEEFNYNILIGSTLYLKNIPYYTIDNIIKLKNNYYKLYFSDINNHNISSSSVLSLEDLMKIYNDYLIRQERGKILRERHISKIVHFTKVDNLENIFEYGLCSIELLNSLGINYSPSDLYRLDGKLDKISTSISFPNYKMFYKKRMEDTSVDWAVITIKPKLIVDKLDSEFYIDNAARGMYPHSLMPTANRDLERMFHASNRASHIPSYYTTNPQAEILINNNISTGYFMNVESNKNIPKVRSLTRDAHVDYNPSSRLFDPRSDYSRWQ